MDIERWPNRHTAFGIGIHRCAGSHLGRAMAKELLTQILQRMGDYVVDLDALERYPQQGTNTGWQRIPATFTPGPATAHHVMRILVAGAGLAALRTVEQLRASDWSDPITVVGAEPHPPYNRPPLTKEALRGGIDPDALRFPQRPSTDDVEWRLGRRVDAVDLRSRHAILDDGNVLAVRRPRDRDRGSVADTSAGWACAAPESAPGRRSAASARPRPRSSTGGDRSRIHRLRGRRGRGRSGLRGHRGRAPRGATTDGGWPAGGRRITPTA